MGSDDRHVGAIWLAVAYLGVLAVETAIPFSFGGERVRLDLLLILTVFIGLNLGPVTGGAVGAVSGLLQELVGGRVLVTLVATKALVGYGAGLLHGQLNERNPLVPAMAVAGMTLLHDLVLITGYLMQGWVTGAADLFTLLFYRTLPAAAIHTVIAVLLYATFRRLLGRRGWLSGQEEGST